ncbi:MAG: ABC transporter permease [Propionibacteriaceae bacterium]|jgi:peptide/nickel transport system permease protein|nr:ABC transporter permease [Propionibacteriaceae bacterium]
MTRLLARWLANSVLLLFVVSGLTFVLISLAPGDAARSILGQRGTEQDYLDLRAKLGLDDPFFVRYGRWLGDVFHGDLGQSMFNNVPVTRLIGERIGVTLCLVLGALAVIAVVGVLLGVASARFKGKLGRFLDVVALLGVSVPNFWIGLVLVTVFSVGLRLFPATGYTWPSQSLAGWLRCLVLPVVTLAIAGIATVAKQTRDAMSTQLSQEYVQAMRAQGLSERSIVYRHVLKNAAVPLTTVLGLMLVGLFSGTVLVESIFALPGLGGLVVSATTTHDIPVVEGVALVFALMVVTVNLVVDLLYRAVNPKVRTP